jgi:hypothetical protein
MYICERAKCRGPRAKSNSRFGESRTVTETKAASSLLRFAPIRRIERKQYATGLAPKGRFIAAEAIECEIGQIGQAQEAAGELDCRTIGFSPSSPPANSVCRFSCLTALNPSFTLETREILWAANPGIARSLLGFAPIQRIERKQDPANLAPKGWLRSG